eukprot:CAMPEP_0176452860 /NCGR_PEP_ID=MMETSP0127-20121128/28841_1 /TAXON_ID=938130 /ORGANISM="Platyophrya macrostoma, Strain WH" /LENGTH=120 /DNA_ID=CAMNT_0017841503 /DNA_START=51 /DNA_END=410 /DNA_ORIENTATION=+
MAASTVPHEGRCRLIGAAIQVVLPDTAHVAIIRIVALPVGAVDGKAEAPRREFRGRIRILVQRVDLVERVQHQVGRLLLHHGARRRRVGPHRLQRLAVTHAQERDRALVPGVPGLQQRPP